MKAPQYLCYAALLLGTSALAGPASAADEVFKVFFSLNSVQLDPAAAQEIARAVNNWQRTGAGEINVIGHSDTSGNAGYNLQLSKQRADAVEVALLRRGVPANQIIINARGQDDLLVPTNDGVAQGSNRRVEIVVPQREEVAQVVPVVPAAPQPVTPEPAAQAPAPAPVPAPVISTPDPSFYTLAFGPVWGKNFGENDNGAENDLVGAELTFRVLPGFLGGVSLSQMGLYAFNAIDDGLTGRTVASLDFAPDFGIFRPTLAINGGAVYGEGVQDGFIVGPELRFDVNPTAGLSFGLKFAYDYQFETGDFEEGIVWTGLDLGLRF